MSGTLPADAWRLEGISPRAYQHPAEWAAAAALRRIPFLDDVVRRLVSLGYERTLRAVSLGSAVRLGDGQLPVLWSLHHDAYRVLDVERVPDLYLTQFPLANAATIGADRPIVVLNSELVRLLDDPGRHAVLAHEAAHVHADHVLYRTALLILLNATAPRLPALAGLPVLAIRLALLEWSRAAELSCDRAAALVVRDPLAVCRALMVLSAGALAEELSLDAFIAQASEYDAGGSGAERLTKLANDLNVTHPMPVRRVRELLDWVRGGDYDRIVDGAYLRRGQEPPLRDEAGSTGAVYGRRVADAVAQAGTTVADLGDQLRGWLDRQRPEG